MRTIPITISTLLICIATLAMFLVHTSTVSAQPPSRAFYFHPPTSLPHLNIYDTALNKHSFFRSIHLPAQNVDVMMYLYTKTYNTEEHLTTTNRLVIMNLAHKPLTLDKIPSIRSNLYGKKVRVSRDNTLSYDQGAPRVSTCNLPSLANLYISCAVSKPDTPHTINPGDYIVIEYTSSDTIRTGSLQKHDWVLSRTNVHIQEVFYPIPISTFVVLHLTYVAPYPTPYWALSTPPISNTITGERVSSSHLLNHIEERITFVPANIL